MYSIEILGVVYTFRSATRGELKEISKLPSVIDQEEELCKTCLMGPDIDYDLSPAGIITSISNKIKEVSGLTGNPLFEAEARSWATSPRGKREILMMGILNKSIEEIDSLNELDWHKSSYASQILAASIYNLDVEKFVEMDFFNENVQRQKER